VSLLALNLLLAAGWVAASGDVSGANLALGFAVGFAALYLTRPLFGPTRYFARARGAVVLTGYFVYDLFVSSFRVAWDVVTPPINARPGLIEMPLDARTDTEILLTANLISLTPGTLSLDVSEDRGSLLVHAMFAEDEEAVKRDLKQGIERRVLEAFR